MEAALRTVYEVVTAKRLAGSSFTEVRGLKGIRNRKSTSTAQYIKVMAVNTLSKAREVMDLLRPQA